MQQIYAPDPGGVFASDVHRRVAANLPVPGEEPLDVETLLARLHADVYTPITDDERVALESVLSELEAVGFAKSYVAGWRLLKGGLEALKGPALTETVFVNGEPEKREPPPLEGPKLEEAEDQIARIGAEDLAMQEAAKADGVRVAEEQLEAARDAAGVS